MDNLWNVMGQGLLHGVRILLVEDDPDTLAMFATVLETHGAEVLCAADGQQAVDWFAERRPDLVITDIGLPSVDGHQVVRYLRRMGLAAPAIAVTAMASADARFRSAELGFDLHLTKPIDPDVLVRAVRGVVTTAGAGAPAPWPGAEDPAGARWDPRQRSS